MSYVRAEHILPDDLIELIQTYIDGQTIYIPRKIDSKKSWGENTKIRQELKKRNQLIVSDYQNNLSMEQLSKKYFLSIKSIQRIIYKSKIDIV